VNASADNLPKVDLNADNIGPRPIEQLTSQVVARDYANAWQTMAQALDKNSSGPLESYFTGWAKENLTKRIADQKSTGLHTHYVDHGHALEAIFYSPAGDLMQLHDRAQLEIQTLDGDKVIDQQQVTLHYVVLMTPGADRWLVRDLQAVPEAGH
jgi:hypothetical protein